MDAASSQPEVEHTPCQRLRLDNIAEDVQHLIASDLAKSSPSALFALAQTSQILRQAALPLLYRDVVLCKDDEQVKTVKRYEVLVERFRARREYNIARHVRSLTIKGNVPEDDFVMVLNKIGELGILRKMNWETSVHIPPSVLDKLHNTWPGFDLSVHVLRRQEAKKSSDRQVDEKLLSSPLLKSLTYEVIYKRSRTNDPSTSEWAKVTQAISAGGSLRVLRIKIQRGEEEPESEAMVKASGGGSLPSLDEFPLQGAYDYNWNDEHCSMLAHSVNMSKLRTLTFSYGVPSAFFKTYTGRLPSLDALRLKVGHMGDWSFTAGFIESIDQLALLDIDAAPSKIESLWPAIMSRRRTLGNLCLRAQLGLKRLRDVVDCLPRLRHLGWKVPYKDRSSYFELMSCIRLERLDILMFLPAEVKDYCNEPIRGKTGAMDSRALIMARAQSAVKGIMQDLVRSEESKLKRLTLHFTRLDFDCSGTGWTLYRKIQIRREQHANHERHFEVHGKNSQRYNEQLDEGLELEWPDIL